MDKKLKMVEKTHQLRKQRRNSCPGTDRESPWRETPSSGSFCRSAPLGNTRQSLERDLSRMDPALSSGCWGPAPCLGWWWRSWDCRSCSARWDPRLCTSVWLAPTAWLLVAIVFDLGQIVPGEHKRQNQKLGYFLLKYFRFILFINT